ncbi:hypothetical protein [Promicromonospora sp. NFX87]|uniref:hypothetical protein n=1 Tax=Promicromonospora sp. NFX87 TaxID=3402691 RepID=UPI003AFB071D
MPHNSAAPIDVGLTTSICSAYADDAGPGTPDRQYWAVVDHEQLPGAHETSVVQVLRGAAVEIDGLWAFFDSFPPAASFARAGRMSNLAATWELFEAAELRAFCATHQREEAALLLGRQVYERTELSQFVAEFVGSASIPLRSYRPAEYFHPVPDVDMPGASS